MCRQQASMSQYSPPASGVTADVCSKEKVDFCRETYEMPKNIPMAVSERSHG